MRRRGWRFHGVSLRRWHLAIVALGWAGCGGGSSSPAAVSAMITPAQGGTLTSADGKLTITFPPGAVSAPTSVSVAVIPPFTAMFPAVGATAYRLQPEGLQFNAAAQPTATLTVALADAQTAVGPIPNGAQLPPELQPEHPDVPNLLIVSKSAGGKLELLPFASTSQPTAATLTVTASVEHFTDWETVGVYDSIVDFDPEYWPLLSTPGTDATNLNIALSAPTAPAASFSLMQVGLGEPDPDPLARTKQNHYIGKFVTAWFDPVSTPATLKPSELGPIGRNLSYHASVLVRLECRAAGEETIPAWAALRQTQPTPAGGWDGAITVRTARRVGRLLPESSARLRRRHRRRAPPATRNWRRPSRSFTGVPRPSVRRATTPPPWPSSECRSCPTARRW